MKRVSVKLIELDCHKLFVLANFRKLNLYYTKYVLLLKKKIMNELESGQNNDCTHSDFQGKANAVWF